MQKQHRAAWLLSTTLFWTAGVGLAGRATAQCWPFSKLGMTEVQNWSAGSTLRLGRADATAAGINLEFEHDATVGIRLVRTSHRHVRGDGKLQFFDFSHTPPAPESNALWGAVLRPVGDQTPYPVGPQDAGSFRLYVDGSGPHRTLILSWRDICTPGIACAHHFWFELRIQESWCQPGRFEFASRMARLTNPAGGATVTLDEVNAPIIYTQQPGDSLKSRVLVPAAQNLPLPATNLPMRGWQLFGLAADLEHPARGQQMQFSALYAGDSTAIDVGPDVLSPFRKILYFATEDRSGYYKRFKHNVVSDASGLAYYRWAPTYFPSYGPTPFLNCFQSGYPAVFEGLTARNDAFWYDVCANYRNFVRCKMGLTPMRSRFYRMNREAAGGKSVVVATINLENNPNGEEAVFADYIDHAKNLQEVFQAPGTNAPAKVFMEWQKWLNGLTGTNEDLIGPDFNPRPFTGTPGAPKEPSAGAIAQIARAAQENINISTYTLPTSISTADWSSFDPDWLLRNRMGDIIPQADGHLIDFGYREVPYWFANSFFDDILDSVPGIGGLYLDTLGGRGSFLRYPSDPSQFWNDPKSYYLNVRGKLRKQRYHGGTAYVRGAQRTFDFLWLKLRYEQIRQRSSERPFIATEAVQEFFAGRYDAAQHGLKAIPGHTQLSAVIEQFSGLAGDPMPVQAAANNPPLWNAVYHEYSRAEALGMMLNTEAVAANLGGGSDAPFPGITWQDWGAYNRMIHSLMFVGGMKASLFSYFQDYENESLIQTGVAGPEIQNDSVPEQADLLAFMQRLHQAGARDCEAGDFLNHGSMERPLTLPQPVLLPGGFLQRQLFFVPGTVDTTFSPSPVTAAQTLPLLGVTRHYNEDGFTTFFPYQIPKVLHSVWRTSPYSTTLGVVVVNWSDDPAYWQAEFDPSVYAGFGEEFTVTGLSPDGAGVQTFPVGSGSGATTLGFSDQPLDINLRHFSQGALEKMPPRSVQVFLIKPQ